MGANGFRRWIVPTCWGVLIVLWASTPPAQCAMSHKQLLNSMDMMRSACAPKYKVSTEMLDGLRKGVFEDDRELQCYTMCIAQMAGTLTKKGELNIQKTLSQLDAMLPPEMKATAMDAVRACRETQSNYKDTCEKTFYTTKCLAAYDPKTFLFP